MRRLCSGFLGRSALIVLASSSTVDCALPRRACFVVEAPSHRWSSTTATAPVPTEDANAAPVNLVTPSDEAAEKACRVVRFLPKSGFIVASHPDEPTSNILVTHARADEALKAQWNELRVGSVINLRFDRTKNPGPCAYFATSATLCVNNNEDTTHLRSVEVVVVHTSEAEGTSLAISAATHKARFDIKERFPVGTRLNVDANAISKDKFVVINVNEEIAKPTVLEKIEVELTEETTTQGNFFARWVDSETGALNRLLVSNKLAAEAKIRLRTGVKLLVDVVSFKPTTRLDRALKIHSVTAEADEQKRDLIVVAPQFLRGTAVLLGCPNDRFKTYVFPIKALNGVELRKGDHVQAVIEDATDGQSYPSLHSLSVVGNLPSFRLKNCRVVHHDEESKNVTLVSEDGRKVTAFAPSSESRNVGDVYYSLECRDMPGCESAVCLGFHDSSAVVLANVHARYLGPERTGRQGVVIVPSTGKGDQIFGDAPRYARFSKAASPKPGELRRGDPLLCQVTAGVNLTPLISEWKFTPNLTDMKSLAELEEALNEHKLRRDTGGETTKKPSTTSRPSETAFVISLDATGTILTAGDDGWTAHAAGLDVSVAFSVADLAPGTNRKNLTVNTQIKLDVWITSTNIFVGRNVRL